MDAACLPAAGLYAPRPISSYDGPLPPFSVGASCYHCTRATYFQSSGPTSGVGSSHPYTLSATEYEGLFKNTQVGQSQTSHMPHRHDCGNEPHGVWSVVVENTVTLDLAKQPGIVCHRKLLSTLSQSYKIPSNGHSQSCWLTRRKSAGLSRKWCSRFDTADLKNTASTTKTMSPLHMCSASKAVQVPEI